MSNIVRAEPFHIQAYKHIQRNLLENVYSPGEKLTETSLATQLGISRGPVREAVRLLLHDGLLVQKGVHMYVYNPNFDDVHDVYLCRERLEPLGARQAAKNITNDSKNRLTQILDYTESALNNKEPNNKIAKLTASFHEQITLSSNNQQLIQTMQVIRAKASYMRNVLLGDLTRKGFIIEEHLKIANAIIEGKSDQAENAMRVHIQKDFNRWKEIFSEKED